MASGWPHGAQGTVIFIVLSPTVHANIMVKATAGEIPVLPPLVSLPKGASLTEQSQETIHGESLTFFCPPSL